MRERTVVQRPPVLAWRRERQTPSPDFNTIIPDSFNKNTAAVYVPLERRRTED